MGIFNFFKKEKTDLEQYYEDREKRAAFEENSAAGPVSGFRLVVEDTFSITGRGTVIVGEVESGTVSVGDEVMLKRIDGSSRKVAVVGIEQFRKMTQKASAGDKVGILLRGLTKNDIGKGDVLYD